MFDHHTSERDESAKLKPNPVSRSQNSGTHRVLESGLTKGYTVMGPGCPMAAIRMIKPELTNDSSA